MILQLVLIVVVMMGLATVAVVEYSIVKEEFCVLLMAAETEFDERFTTTS